MPETMETFSCDDVTQAPRVDHDHLRRLLHTSYGVSHVTFTNLTGYEDCNFLLSDLMREGAGPNKAILKVTNPLEAKNEENIDFQVKLCEYLNEKGIPCPKVIKRLDGRCWAFEEVTHGVCLPVRVFEVLPGSNLENFLFEPNLVEDLGEMLAKFHVIADEAKLSVKHIPHISVEYRHSLLKEMDLLLEQRIISKEKAQLISECFAEFEDKIANHPDQHEIGLIHSDVNETNVLISEENGVKKITGLLDFGDVHVSYRLVDVATTVLYLHLSDRLNQGIDVLATALQNGYRRVRPTPDCAHLISAMKARLSCSLIYGLRYAPFSTARINLRGENPEYILRTQKNGWKVLRAGTDELGTPHVLETPDGIKKIHTCDVLNSSVPVFRDPI